MLANIYLHHCLDAWFDENWAAHAQMVRYADDAVFVFTSEEKAAEFKEALKARLRDFGNLKLNEDKSGILKFDSHSPKGDLPFLGFSLYWGRDRRIRENAAESENRTQKARERDEAVLGLD